MTDADIRIYQYADGSYLPSSSQPSKEDGYLICSKKYTPHNSTRYINVSIGDNGLPMMRVSEKLVSCDKMLPELYKKREECCGCTACYAVCPKQAIYMRPCEEGFLYPVIDAAKCIRCNMCKNICPI